MQSAATQSLALAFGVGSLISLGCVRLGVPAILPLLLAGIALGRSGLGLVDSTDLGQGLGAFITVAIGVLIFEGGLHLDRAALKKAPRAVWGLLTRGALVSVGATAVLAHFVFDMDWTIAFLLGAILMVTGPTVVQPILRRVRVTPGLHSALSTEAVLIDPIGVIVAVSLLDVSIVYARGSFEGSVESMVIHYLRPMAGGLVIGAAMGLVARVVMRLLTRRRRVDSTQMNLLAIAACTLSVGLGEWMAREAGLVATTVCAVMMANSTVSGMRDMRLFKEQISIMLVGALFVLLVSRIEVSRLLDFGQPELIFLAGVVFVVRPLGVAIGTFRSVLTLRERAFAGLMAPRGIVAASVASISAAALIQTGREIVNAGGESAASEAIAAQGMLLEQLIYQVIFVTVILAGTLAWPLAWLLGVNQGQPKGVLIVGAHALGRQFAEALKQAGVEVRLIDSNAIRVANALASKLPAVRGDATDLRWMEEQAITPDIGWIIAWTGNDDVDRVVCRWGAERFKPGRAVIWGKPSQSAADESLRVIGDGESVATVVDQLERQEKHITSWTGDRPHGRLLAMVTNGQLSLPTSNGRSAKPGTNAVLIGIE